ncbi:WxPxxD family membrane protein [Ornithinibacillus contaminans]|uniref:WxPxxD family membrane protein n=1 Tax=Ornithinibacillus contaminans TaxID=694055 RepID=UPI00064DF476|nr:WxPxxD family membrane protein [Ornithinibacillus contaminans]
MLIKRIAICIWCFLFFCVVWLLQGRPYLDLPTQEAIYWLNNTAFGYNSILAYCLFYPIPFFIFLNHLFLIYKPFAIVKWTTRSEFYNKIIKEIVISAFLFSVLQMLVNIFLTSILLDVNILIEENFFVIAFINMVTLIVYFTWIGILYRLFYDWNNSIGLAYFFAFILIGVLYFIGKLLIDGIWYPTNDLVVFQFLLEKKWFISNVTLVYLRQGIICLILYLVASTVFFRKDIIN